jgi:hypothetical protein
VLQPGGFGWTTPDPRAISFALPASTPRGTHTLFVMALDDAGGFTIGMVQVAVVVPGFDRAVLYLLDSPGMSSGLGTGPGMTTDENVAFWKDILETGRYWRNTEGGTLGPCTPVAGSDSFIVNHGFYSPALDLPFSVISRYRVVVWFVSQETPTLPQDFVLHHFVTGGGYNTLLSYLQAGGRVWGFGGGFARALSAQRTPTYPISPDSEKVKGSFLYDFLGVRGSVKIVPTLNTSVNPTRQPNLDPRLEAVEPHAIPFTRVVGGASRTARIPHLTFDYERYDTLPPDRYDPATQYTPFTTMSECLAGLPSTYEPARPESSAWQPLAVYRARGVDATASFKGLAKPVPLDGAIVGWYRKGTSLPTRYRTVAAPYQLFYFGVDLSLLHREEVRALADLLLSTEGWNIWRGGCPPRSPSRVAASGR